jgi:hypothetical protein
MKIGLLYFFSYPLEMALRVRILHILIVQHSL